MASKKIFHFTSVLIHLWIKTATRFDFSRMKTKDILLEMINKNINQLVNLWMVSPIGHFCFQPQLNWLRLRPNLESLHWNSLWKCLTRAPSNTEKQSKHWKLLSVKLLVVDPKFVRPLKPFVHFLSLAPCHLCQKWTWSHIHASGNSNFQAWQRYCRLCGYLRERDSDAQVIESTMYNGCNLGIVKRSLKPRLQHTICCVSFFSLTPAENVADAVINVLSQETEKGMAGEFAGFTVDMESITGKVKTAGTCKKELLLQWLVWTLSSTHIPHLTKGKLWPGRS